jgi:hypothetical protein
MPINLAENPLSAAKVGSQDLTAAYIGVTQIFPNSTEITSWTGRGATSSYSNTSHSLTTSVTGPTGATFNLIGNNGAVGQTGLTKAVDGAESFSWSISSNDSCDAASRTLSLTLQATGSTTLASPLGGSSNPDTATQSAGPVSGYVQMNGSISATVQNPGNYVTVGGQRQWLSGTIFDVTYSSSSVTNATGTSGASSIIIFNGGSGLVQGSWSNTSQSFGTYTGGTNASWNTSGTPASGQTGSLSGTFTTSTQNASIYFRASFSPPAGCYGITPNSNLFYIYP